VAHRCAAAQSVFEEGGLAVPDLIWQDTEEPGPGQLACLVYRFIAGDHYRPGNLDLLARGFANLARLHAIPAETFRDPYPDAMPPRSLDHDWPLRDDRSSDGDPAKSLRDLFKRAFGPFGRIDTAPFSEWTATAIETVDVRRLPSIILHGDYQKNNVIFGADRTPFTIDLDNVRTGKFCRELGVSLSRWRYGRTANLPYADLRRFGNDDVLKAAEAAYLSSALPESADYWREHRQTFLLAAYSRSIRILLQRGGDRDRFGPLKRLRWSRLALTGWRRLNGHLKSTDMYRRIAATSRVPGLAGADIHPKRRD
jgi:aminoglycoside phosphotransferase (APT) family kinase protein